MSQEIDDTKCGPVEKGTDVAQAEANKHIIRRAFRDVFNAGNPEAVDELYAADFVHHGPPSLGSEIRGGDGVKANVVHWHTAFPDLRFTVETEVSEGDLVVSYWTARGTHRGTLRGIPATGRQVNVSALEMSRIAGGKIVEQWLLWDTLDLLQQLGALPQPVSAATHPGSPSDA